MDTGDTAWVLASAALVLLMTPGLALFYGGMVRAKSVLNMMMMSFGALALISVLWVLYGYSMAFGNDVGGGLLGSPTEFFGLKGLMSEDSLVFTIPSMAFVAFQAVFAIITVALISGADRRPRPLRPLDAVLRHLGHDRLLPGRALGLLLRRGTRPSRRLDRQQARWPSTSPAAPRCTSTPVPPASPWPSSWASASAGARTRCGRTTCRW